MAENLGKAILYLETDTSKYDTGLDKAEKKASAFGGVLKTSFATGLGYLGASSVTQAFDTIVGQFNDATAAASDFNEAQSKVNVVFGTSAPIVEDFANRAATSLGISNGAALGMAGTFGNLFTSIGLTRDEAANMSVDVLTLGSDLASFNNIEPDVALEKLRAGLVGEAEPLRALGINLTEAAVKSKAMELGLVDANGELSESAKVQARFALILDQSTNAQGDFNRTADGTANQQRIMKAQWADLQAEIGQNLLPVQDLLIKGLRALTTWIRDDLSPVVSAMIDTFKREWVPVIEDIAEQVIKLRPVAEPIFKFFVESFERLLEAAQTAASIFGSLVDGDWEQAWQGFRDIAKLYLDQLWEYLTLLPNLVLDAFETVGIDVRGELVDLFENTRDKGKEIGAAILAPFEAARDKILDIIGFGKGFASKVDEVLDNLDEKLHGAPGAFAEVTRTALLSGFEWARDHVAEIVRALGNNAIGALNGVLGGVEGFANLFLDAVNWILEKLELPEIPGLELGRIPLLARGVHGFPGGPAIVGEEGPELVNLPPGANVMPAAESARLLAGHGLAIGGLPGWDDVKDAVTSIPEGLADFVNDVIERGIDWLVDSALAAVGYATPGLPGAFREIPAHLAGRMKDSLWDFAEGLITGIQRDIPMSTGVWARPLASYFVTQWFGRTPFSGVYRSGIHTGVDMATPEGQAVWGTDGGSVALAGLYGGYGNAVMLSHANGLASLYGHLSRIAVAVGDIVSKGSTIGYSGNTGFSTGPHLHFEARENGYPVDPTRFVALASGGIVQSPALALLGERGSEVVLPLDKLAGAGRGINQTIYGLSPDDVTRGTLRAFRQLAMQIA